MRRKRASKANGALSKGPKTPEGKLRSSYNAVRHGLLSSCVVLECEEPEAFKRLLEQFVRRFEPLDDIEFGMVEEMAACLAAAFSDLAATPPLALLNRYEGRLNRMFQRALRNLLLLREKRAAAAQPSVEKKEVNPVEMSETKNDQTNLIPTMNTQPGKGGVGDRIMSPALSPESLPPDDLAA